MSKILVMGIKIQVIGLTFVELNDITFPDALNIWIQKLSWKKRGENCK